MIRRYSIAFLMAMASQIPAQAADNGNPTITSAGTDLAIALPVIAGGIAFYKDDWHGIAQLGAETALTVGTALALKQLVRERRPDGSDYQSFPSDTTALAASGSTFLWSRYGWQYGLPAFVTTQFVAYSRVQAKEHHWYDTLASSALSIGYAQFVTTRFHRNYRIDTSLSASPDGTLLQMSYRY
jgi:membrane-associated phospholipid phosphatase